MIKFFDWLNTIPRAAGFAGTCVFLVIYHLGHLFLGYSIAIVWAQLFLIIGGLLAGRRPALLLSAIISAYAWYAIPGDISRVMQIIVASVLIAFITGYYGHYQRYVRQQALIAQLAASDARRLAEENERAAEMLEELNGNIAKIKDIRIDLRAIVDAYELPPEVQKNMGEILHLLGNLELAAGGWRALHKIREDVQKAKGEIAGKMWRGGQGEGSNVHVR